MMAEEKKSAIRCKACNFRVEVEPGTPTYVCPNCNQGWKIKWLAKDLGMIIAPLGWSVFQQQARRKGGA